MGLALWFSEVNVLSLEMLVTPPIRMYGVIILKTTVRVFASVKTQNLANAEVVLTSTTYNNVTHPESAQSSSPIQIPSSNITFGITRPYISNFPSRHIF